MIPGNNPFKRKDSAGMDNTASSNTNLQETRSPTKVAPPAPIRRASAKKSTTLQTPSINAPSGIHEEDYQAEYSGTSQRTFGQDKLDDADKNELDELERQHGNTRVSSDSQRSVPVPPTRNRRSSSNATTPQAVVTASTPATVSSLLGAPRINGASTPRPFGDDLPTPNIISRDLTHPVSNGSEGTIGGGVTSAGLVQPAQTHTRVAAESHDLQQQQATSQRHRRPSSTGPILCSLGCGTMGRAIFSGVLDALDEDSEVNSSSSKSFAALRPPARFIACVKSSETEQSLRQAWGDSVNVVRGEAANAKAVHDADYILLSCKPQMAHDILSAPEMQESLRGKVIISILAGKTIASLQALCPNSTIIRVMPNTASGIRRGMSVIVLGQGVSQDSLELVRWIFNQVGKTVILDERHIDAATAMCGSGPAFMAIILESMTDGGVQMGLPRVQAQMLAAQTMLGTASMVQAGQHPALIKDAVSTPGGCTTAGVSELEDGKIRSTMARAIQKATEKAAELGRR